MLINYQEVLRVKFNFIFSGFLLNIECSHFINNYIYIIYIQDDFPSILTPIYCFTNEFVQILYYESIIKK